VKAFTNDAVFDFFTLISLLLLQFWWGKNTEIEIPLVFDDIA
jgi:hypothetical protein